MRRLALALILALHALPARPEWLMTAAPTEPRGRAVTLSLVYLNTTASEQEIRLPADVALTLSGGGAPVAMTAASRADDAAAPAGVAPGAFRRWKLDLKLPDAVDGSVMVEATVAPGARTVLVVQSAREPLLAGPGVNPEYGQVRVAPANAATLAPADQTSIEDEPMYIVAGGRGGATAKFQVSVKYPIWRRWNLYAGYTQQSVWDLAGDSKPFRDNSYRPSLFWYEPRVLALPADRGTLGLRAGFEHESNGRGGAQSRSINIAYLRPELRVPLGNGDTLEFKPKLYRYIDKDENTDIGRYRGYADWTLRYVADTWLVGALLRRGSSGGAAQVDVSWRPAGGWTRNPDEGFFLYAQLFSGYGETMLDYNQKRPAQLRFGIGIVR